MRPKGSRPCYTEATSTPPPLVIPDEMMMRRTATTKEEAARDQAVLPQSRRAKGPQRSPAAQAGLDEARQ